LVLAGGRAGGRLAEDPAPGRVGSGSDRGRRRRPGCDFCELSPSAFSPTSRFSGHHALSPATKATRRSSRRSLRADGVPYEGCGFLNALDGPLNSAARRQENEDAPRDRFLRSRLKRSRICSHLWPVKGNPLVQRDSRHGVSLVVNDHKPVVPVNKVDKPFQHPFPDHGPDVSLPPVRHAAARRTAAEPSAARTSCPTIPPCSATPSART